MAYKMQVCNCTLADLGVNPRTYIPKLSAENYVAEPWTYWTILLQELRLVFTVRISD